LGWLTLTLTLSLTKASLARLAAFAAGLRVAELPSWADEAHEAPSNPIPNPNPSPNPNHGDICSVPELVRLEGGQVEFEMHVVNLCRVL